LNGLPHLIKTPKQVIVSFGPVLAYWYDVSGSSYTPLLGAKEALHHDAGKHLFEFVETTGTVYEFHDFNSSHAGQFRRAVTVGTAAIEVTEWTPQGSIKTVHYKISDTAIACKLWQYSYITGGKNDGRLQSILFRGRTKSSQSWTDDETQVCRATYSYYVTARSEPNGLIGALKTVVRQSWSRDAWAGDNTYYYRYYTDPPRAHLLKMAFSAQSYANAKAVYPDPTSPKVSDENLLRFSSRSYDYNADRQVIRARVGGRESRYSYTRNSRGSEQGN
jgi:hypothetical protein